MSRFLPAVLVAVVFTAPADAQKQVIIQPGIDVLPGGGPSPVPGRTPAISDADALKSAGLTESDGEKLIGYLKLRTVSDADQGKINGLIKQLGADQFTDRIKAGEALEFFGPAAIGLLKAAETNKDGDPEIAYQAGRVLKRMEKIPHSAVAAAAVRAVVKTKPAGAASALLGFLPLADSDALANEIRGALVALAAPGGKPEPALVAALSDASHIRRGAAYLALIEGGPAEERIRIKESFDQVKAAVKKETDTAEKFRGLWSLVLTARDRDSMSELIAMVPQLPRGRIWQLEDLLLQLAGTAPEGGRFGKSTEALEKARDAWAGWWEKKGASIDLAKLVYKPRMLGITDIVEYDRNNGTGRFVSIGADQKERFSFNGNSLYDAKFMPNGRYLCLENYSQVVEREADGTMLPNPRNLVQQPVGMEATPNGGQLIMTRQFVYQYDKDGKQEWMYQRQNTADIVAGCRMPNGDTFIVMQSGKKENALRLDSKGKPVGQGLTVGAVQYYGYCPSVEATGDEKILLCEQNRVTETDLKTGKTLWTYNVMQPTCAQRLPNGNTLISAFNNNQSRAIEVDSNGDILWEYKSKDGYSILKAYRR